MIWLNFQKALKNWEESLKLYQQLNDENSSAQLLFLIGVIYKNWSEYDDAIDYYNKSLEINETLNFLINHEFETYDEAITWWNKNKNNYDEELFEKDDI